MALGRPQLQSRRTPAQPPWPRIAARRLGGLLAARGERRLPLPGLTLEAAAEAAEEGQAEAEEEGRRSWRWRQIWFGLCKARVRRRPSEWLVPRSFSLGLLQVRRRMHVSGR